MVLASLRAFEGATQRRTFRHSVHVHATVGAPAPRERTVLSHALMMMSTHSIPVRARTAGNVTVAVIHMSCISARTQAFSALNSIDHPTSQIQ